VTRRPQLYGLHNNKQAFEESLGNFSAGNMRQREHLDEATVACWVTFSGEAIRPLTLFVAPHALYLASGPLGPAKRAEIIALAAESRIPAIYSYRVFAVAGGLMSFAADGNDLFRRAAIFVDEILKGANPADLPVEEPTKFELVINLRAAKALGLTVPQSLLARADEVIE